MEDIFSYIIKLTTGMIGILVILRLLGKKEMAQITPLDFVYALILGNIVGEALYETETPFFEMLLNLIYWAVLIYIIERLALNSHRFRSFTKGEATVLIDDGHLNPQMMNKNNMDVDEVRELLRLQGVFTLRDVKYAILENSGEISVLTYSQERVMNDGEIKEDTLPYLFIDMGGIQHQVLQQAGVDEAWLRHKLKEETGLDAEDIFIAEWSRGNGFFIQEK